MVGVFLRNQGLVASDPEGPDTLNPSTPRPIRRAYQPRSDPKSPFGRPHAKSPPNTPCGSLPGAEVIGSLALHSTADIPCRVDLRPIAGRTTASSLCWPFLLQISRRTPNSPVRHGIRVRRPRAPSRTPPRGGVCDRLRGAQLDVSRPASSDPDHEVVHRSSASTRSTEFPDGTLRP